MQFTSSPFIPKGANLPRAYDLGAQKKLPLIKMVLLSTHICFDLEMRKNGLG